MLETAAVFLVFAALGVATMAPAITFGDAGEFAAGAAVWGIPHAPGYPLYTALAKALGGAFPFGSWAYRTNLLSALAGAAALAVFCSALRAAGLGRAARWGAAAALGLCPQWRYASEVTEVFSLHLLCLAGLMRAAAGSAGRFWEDRRMAAVGLVCGLGLANHQTLALAVPAVLWEGRLRSGRPARPLRSAAVSAAFLALGMAAYLCLPLRASANPPLDWGHPVDLARFLHVLLRKDYGSLSLTVEGQAAQGRAAALAAQAARFFVFAWRDLGPAAVLLAAAGLAAGARASFPAFWLLMTGPFFLCLGNPPFDAQTSGALERFYLAPAMGAAWLAALALDRVARAGAGGRACAVVLACALCGFGLSTLPKSNERSDFAAYDYGRSVQRSLPKGATLIMDGGDDTFYALSFLDYAQGLRPDLDLHDRGGVVFKSLYGPDFRALGAREKEARRAAVESSVAAGGALFYSTFNDKILEGYELEPWGLVKRAARKTEGPPPGLWELYPYRWDDARLAAHYRDRALVAIYPLVRGAQEASLPRIRQAWDMAADAVWVKPNAGFMLGIIAYEASRRKDWPLAQKASELALRIAPENGQAMLNLGVAYERTGRAREAEDAYRRAAGLAAPAGAADFDLGALYWGQGRWAESAAAFERAAAARPGDAATAGWARTARSRVK